MERSFFLLSLIVVQVALSQAFTGRGVNTQCYNVDPLLTTSNGAPVDDKTSSMTAGPRGPIVLQDFVLIDELAHFNRERIPERVQHAKGAGAFGYFTVTNASITQYCKASLFQEVGKRTSLVARFSTSVRESGSCDTVRDTLGGAFKFYTDDGNYDLVGVNAHTFWIRDPILFPSLVHASRRDPSSNLLDLNRFWDFITLRPETTHHLLNLYSDKGTPDGYRHTTFYGCHAFKVVNKDGEAYYVKFLLVTDQGERNLTAAAAQRLCATDPDYATRDLYKNIQNKNFPSWTWYYQVMTLTQASKLSYAFDVTKFWPTKDFPWNEIGQITLNENPINYFAEVEQAGFSPSHLVPGIEPSPDKMLQARLFAYPDAQRYRLGVNYQHLPVNRPWVTVTNNQRDGFMCYSNHSRDNYYPNSVKDSARPCPEAAQHKWPVSGDVARYSSRDEDNYSQAKVLYWEKLDDLQRDALISNLASDLKLVKPHIQKRAIYNFRQVDDDLADRVSAAIGSSKKSV